MTIEPSYTARGDVVRRRAGYALPRASGSRDLPGVPPGPTPGEPCRPSPDEVEFLGLGVMVTVMERMGLAERRRALAYLSSRYGESAATP